jgi:hypothetical protein
MPTNNITLGGFLAALESAKPITINLFKQQDELLLITFIKDGYEALEDSLEASEVKRIVLKNMNTLDVYIEVI